MLCKICEKNNATIHLTKITNGHVEEKHLCESCAKENNEFDFELPFSFQKLFTGLLGPMEEQQQETKNISCPQCGLDYKKFMEIGKFGCAKCYETFRKDVRSLLQGIHGHVEHKGKTSKNDGDVLIQRKEIESLQIELAESIAQEDFERAAYLRDKIRRLKAEIGGIEG